MSFREFRSEYKANLREQWKAEKAAENAVKDDIIEPAITDTGTIDLGDHFNMPIYIDEDGTISHDAANENIVVDLIDTSWSL